MKKHAPAYDPTEPHVYASKADGSWYVWDPRVRKYVARYEPSDIESASAHVASLRGRSSPRSRTVEPPPEFLALAVQEAPRARKSPRGTIGVQTSLGDLGTRKQPALFGPRNNPYGRGARPRLSRATLARRAAPQRSRANPKVTHSVVPPLDRWDQFSVKTGERHSSYALTLPHPSGSFRITPIYQKGWGPRSTRGIFLGYELQGSNVDDRPGLWTLIPTDDGKRSFLHRTAASAASTARRYFDQHTRSYAARYYPATPSPTAPRPNPSSGCKACGGSGRIPVYRANPARPGETMRSGSAACSCRQEARHFVKTQAAAREFKRRVRVIETNARNALVSCALGPSVAGARRPAAPPKSRGGRRRPGPPLLQLRGPTRLR